MPIRQRNSEWRSKRVDWHAANTLPYMERKFKPGKLFEIGQVAALPSMEDLSDRYSYDVASALCRQLELDQVIQRKGRFFKFPITKNLKAKPKNRKH